MRAASRTRCASGSTLRARALRSTDWILARGADAYRALGTPGCPGTKALCLNHGFARPGIVEVPFGTPLREVVEIHEFMRTESCGKCVPCRTGSMRAHEIEEPRALAELLTLISDTSLCGFGQLIPKPISELIDRFGDRIFSRGSHEVE